MNTKEKADYIIRRYMPYMVEHEVAQAYLDLLEKCEAGNNSLTTAEMEKLLDTTQ